MDTDIRPIGGQQPMQPQTRQSNWGDQPAASQMSGGGPGWGAPPRPFTQPPLQQQQPQQYAQQQYAQQQPLHLQQPQYYQQPQPQYQGGMPPHLQRQVSSPGGFNSPGGYTQAPSFERQNSAPAYAPFQQQSFQSHEATTSRKYVHDKGMKELIDLNERLNDELKAKDEQMSRMKIEYSEGRQVKDLQAALDDHRKFRMTIQELQDRELASGDRDRVIEELRV